MFKRWLTVLLFVMVAGLLAGGIWLLFLLRFERGDNYPPFSTLRADPLGARALYESFAALPGLEVSRNYLNWNKLTEPSASTLFFLGVTGLEDEIPEEEFHSLNQFIKNGGRVVIALESVTKSEDYLKEEIRRKERERREAEARETKTKKVEKKPAPEKNDKTEDAIPFQKKDFFPPLDDGTTGTFQRMLLDDGKFTRLTDRWRFEMDFQKLPLDPIRYTFMPVTVDRDSSETLPAQLPWRSGLSFIPLDSAWRAHYRRDRDPVVMERTWGKGSIVLLSDAFLMSNQALRDEPQAEVLAWLAGPKRRLLFDERHLGIQQEQGLMHLVRKYRLQWVLVTAFILAVLFIWRNATTLVPPPDDEEDEAGRLGGREAWAGMVDLLRAHLLRKDLLEVCLHEWSKTYAHPGNALKNVQEQLQEVVKAEQARPEKQRNAVEAYRTMARIYKRRNQWMKRTGDKK